jgi:putative hydrolase of the HAD superfamily
MEPPAPRLAAALGVSLAEAERAFRAEIAYYLEHHLEGRDAASLSRLRDRCAAVLRDELALPSLDLATAREAMLDAIRFRAYPDAAPALRSLRERGVAVVVASNWDCSLPRVLADAGLAPLVDGVVASASVGADKPARAVFDAALELAGCGPGDALHVGDSPTNDVGGAAAAGIRAVLLERGEARPDEVPADRAVAPVAKIATLAELPGLL